MRLTLSEFKVLALLAEQPDSVVSRRELMQHLWASEHVGDEHACEVHISNLRRKIEHDPAAPAAIGDGAGTRIQVDRRLACG